MKLKKILIACCLVLILLAVLLFLAWQRISSSGMPLRDGTAQLAGLGSEVTVRWDRWAVPHVEANNLRDASAALGWLHANDRFTQLELGRRAASGRLAEVVGRAAVPLDREARVLRLGATAEKLWQAASPESREMLEGYADGVNAWLQSRGSDLPPGLKILRVKPEPWKPVDSLGFAMLMAKDLSFWQSRPEELRYRQLITQGADTVRQLLGDPDVDVPEQIAALAEEARQKSAAPTVAADAPLRDPLSSAPLEPFLGEPAVLGSNGWLIGASRASGGAPLTVNDPHLGLRLPGTWYQVHIRAPGYTVAGMTLPGLPGVVIGRTPHLAWGLTNTMLDDHDVYFEELDETGTKVRRGDAWVEIESHTEQIPLKGGGSEPVEIRMTEHGPILRAFETWGLPPRSLAWTAHVPGDPLLALLGLARATTLEEARTAVAPYVSPAQNLMVTHRDGGLMYVTLGRLPERRTGRGRMPLPGWDTAYGWDGLRPADTNPFVLDPEDDLIVTANNDVLPEGYEFPFTADFVGPFRADRIRQILEGQAQWTAEAQQQVQTDVVSLYALEVVKAAAGNYEGDAGRALEALEAWDGSMALRGPAALYDLFYEALMEGIFGDEEAGNQPVAYRGRLPLLYVLRGEMPERWFDDVTTEAKEGRDEIVARALESAWRQGHQRWGDDLSRWPYGEIHVLRLDHPVGRVPLLGGFFNRGPLEVPGSATSVNAFGGPWAGEGRVVRFGPSMRWVVDFADPDQGLAGLPGGQSGHPKDPHYDDQLPLFLEGRLRPAPWSDSAIGEATVATLVLQPGN